MISVDTKKKALVGNYKNGGSDYRPKGDPQRVNVHDFVDRSSARRCPTASTTWRTTPDSSASDHERHREFAVEAIRSWLGRMGANVIRRRES